MYFISSMMKIVKVSARAPPCQGMVESWGVVSITGKRKTPGSLCQWAICLFGGGKGLLRARKNGQWSSCSGMLLVGARTLRVFHLHIWGKEPYKDIKEVQPGIFQWSDKQQPVSPWRPVLLCVSGYSTPDCRALPGQGGRTAKLLLLSPQGKKIQSFTHPALTPF